MTSKVDDERLPIAEAWTKYDSIFVGRKPEDLPNILA